MSLWHKCLAPHVSYVGSDVDGRCMAIRLTINCRVIILFTVYFPCLSSYKTDLSQCSGFIDSVISVNNGSDVVIMGDMNFTYCNDNSGLPMCNIFFCTIVLVRISRSVITFWVNIRM